MDFANELMSHGIIVCEPDTVEVRIQSDNGEETTAAHVFLGNKFFLFTSTNTADGKAELIAVYARRDSEEPCVRDLILTLKTTDSIDELLTVDTILHGYANAKVFFGINTTDADDVIFPARFTSVWDDDYAVTTDCKVNLATREVFDIEKADIDGVDMLTSQYITLPDQSEYDVFERDDCEEGAFWYE